MKAQLTSPKPSVTRLHMAFLGTFEEGSRLEPCFTLQSPGDAKEFKVALQLNAK
jgi:hypothetical protein